MAFTKTVSDSRVITTHTAERIREGRNSSDVRNRNWVMCPPQYDQSNEILSCSNGIGTNLSNTIDLEASSGSVCGGTSSRMRSGLIDNSMLRYHRRSAPFPQLERYNENRTFSCKVKQGRELLSVWHPRALPSELVEEWMAHRLDRTQTRLGGVFEQF